jgi:quinol monooxygenase YgiN
MGEHQAAHANDASAVTVYVVAYLEVMPRSLDRATALLKQYREASRQAAGNVRLEVLQQSARPDHFALVELWQDQSAVTANATAAYTQQCRAQLRPLCVSPYDERPHTGLSLGATLAAGTIYVVTHADAIPAGKDEAMVLLTQLAEASRTEAGNMRFEVLQQHSRQNHFTLVELWEDQQTREAHVMAAHTRQFREQFQPLSGALYDERLYTALD